MHNGNPVELSELLFIIIHKCESAVVLESNMLRCEGNSVSISFPRDARQDSELLFELTRSFCCRQKVERNVLTFAICISSLFVRVNQSVLC